MSDLQTLIDTQDPGLPYLQALLKDAERPCEMLPPSSSNAEVLLHLHVTTRSLLGTVAYHTGGILIDHGWLRILGSGDARLTRDLKHWNADPDCGYLLVADDAAGGFFALNGGGLGADIGALYYWAPDSLDWEALNIGYSDFLGWALSEQSQLFYDGLRWASWQADVRTMSADQCVSFFPFLWTHEGTPDGSARKVVSVQEQFAVKVELAGQLGSVR
ncbi:DUF2625 domain-containing protein [Pseudomonas sp. S75]|uniref:DUF2625 family protein n=1 Tax=unclassified Pseudomonas TaxID=196821 RepID=UPI001902F0EB|nr:MULTISPECIES: DUF2625 family protein [unclassified Pseudomonas]MBJ9978291.1 DUF2625 domain-containing protein [Pseudomonas sp. S30]MBK0156173.1 DUF2625 domain-containing protein [Pseudomonas sp. S75]